MAAIAGTSRRTWRQLETVGGRPTLQVLIALARHFSVSMDAMAAYVALGRKLPI
jgi:hypothetical protein